MHFMNRNKCFSFTKQCNLLLKEKGIKTEIYNKVFIMSIFLLKYMLGSRIFLQLNVITR